MSTLVMVVALAGLGLLALGLVIGFLAAVAWAGEILDGLSFWDGDC